MRNAADCPLPSSRSVSLDTGRFCGPSLHLVFKWTLSYYICHLFILPNVSKPFPEIHGEFKRNKDYHFSNLYWCFSKKFADLVCCMCLSSSSPPHSPALSSESLHYPWLVVLSASSSLFLSGQESEKRLQFLDVGVKVHSLVLKWLSCCQQKVDN